MSHLPGATLALLGATASAGAGLAAGPDTAARALLARILGGVGGLREAAAALAQLLRGKASLADVQWESPWLLLALLPLLLLVTVGLWQAREPRLLLARGAEALVLAARGGVGRAQLARGVARLCAVVAMVLWVVAAARPTLLGEPDPEVTEGIDVVVALDISGSMRAVDFRPKDRLHVAKSVIEEHVLSRPRDRVGLVVFAGEAFTQAPLTHDKALLKEILAGVRIGVIQDGTAIGDGLALSLARLQQSRAKSRAVILLTDGDNNAGVLAPESASALAAEMGVRVFPVLVGKGGRVPFPDGLDIFGAPRFVNVDMPVNPALLKRMATQTGGTFFQATDRASLAGSFQQILEDLDKSVLEGAPVLRRRIELGPVPMVLGLVLLMWAMALRLTRGLTVP